MAVSANAQPLLQTPSLMISIRLQRTVDGDAAPLICAVNLDSRRPQQVAQQPTLHVLIIAIHETEDAYIKESLRHILLERRRGEPHL